MRLYLKHRPKTFSEIVGQRQVVVPVQNALETGSFPHSVLFYGLHGSGKTTLARIVAMYLNCTGENKPCGECDSCQQILSKRAQDVIEINAADHRGIDAIRQVIDRAKYSPLGQAKVFILDEAHRLTTDAQNSLLKILEEPPKGVYFILATTEKEKLLPTIISRCQTHNFTRTSDELIINNLRHICEVEGAEVEEQNLVDIAQQSGGSIRDSITLLEKVLEVEGADLDKVLGIELEAEVKKLKAAMEAQDLGECFLLIQQIHEQSPNWENIFLLLESEFHKELLNRSNLRLTLKVFEALSKWRTSVFPVNRLTLELACAQLCLNKVETSPSATANGSKRPWERSIVTKQPETHSVPSQAVAGESTSSF